MSSANDMQAARKTYEGFIALLKWSIPPIVIITLLIIIGISS